MKIHHIDNEYFNIVAYPEKVSTIQKLLSFI